MSRPSRSRRPIDDKPDRVPLTDGAQARRGRPRERPPDAGAAGGELDRPGNCNRTIPVFDGAARFDMVLTYGETRQVEKPGYSGPVLVCNARYVPIAGHRSLRPATKFMEDNQDMQVWLAPVEGARVLVPLRIAVRTMVGMSVIEASRWALGDGKAVPGAAERAARAERRPVGLTLLAPLRAGTRSSVASAHDPELPAPCRSALLGPRGRRLPANTVGAAATASPTERSTRSRRARAGAG